MGTIPSSNGSLWYLQYWYLRVLCHFAADRAGADRCQPVGRFCQVAGLSLEVAGIRWQSWYWSGVLNGHKLFTATAVTNTTQLKPSLGPF